MSEDAIEEQSSEPTENEFGCGSILAQAREQQGKQIDAIAEQLNLSVSQIRAIEMDQSKGLPEATYVRGYIRAYSKLLELDPEEVLAHYIPPEGKNSSGIHEIHQATQSIDDAYKSSNMLVNGIIALVLIGAGLTWYYGFKDKQQTPTVIGQTDAIEDRQFDVEDIDTIVVAEQVTNQPTISTDSQQTPTQAAIENQTKSASDDVLHRLQLQFVETSWVDVREIDGQRLAYQTYPKGEILTLESQLALRVLINNIDGVVVKYNDELFDLEAHREGVYARFELGQ